MTRAHSRRSSDTMQKIQKLVGRRLLSTQRSFLRVDLRSDTVTTPSAGMLEAMRKADVGDDYYMEDPTTTILEKRMAQLCKKEAALFVPSGTMGNLVALGTHCSRGDEIIIGDKSHIFYYEGGGASSLMGIAYHPVKNQVDGSIRLSDISAALREPNLLYARTRLVSVENTHNMTGGRLLDVKYMTQLAKLCKKNQLQLHVDGARIFNAAVKLDVEVSDLLSGADTASVCLSKGLGCPVGSVIVGPEKFIHDARRLRKTVGGGMRQIGSLAAAGLYALDHNIPLLKMDHVNASLFADCIAEHPEVSVITRKPDTNIVVFSFRSGSKLLASAVVEELKMKHGVLMNAMNGNRIRAVTHLDLSEAHILAAAEAVKTVASSL